MHSFAAWATSRPACRDTRFTALPSKSMSWWSRLVGGKSRDVKPQRLDYLSEALALERQGDFDAVLLAFGVPLLDEQNRLITRPRK